MFIRDVHCSKKREPRLQARSSSDTSHNGSGLKHQIDLSHRVSEFPLLPFHCGYKAIEHSKKFFQWFYLFLILYKFRSFDHPQARFLRQGEGFLSTQANFNIIFTNLFTLPLHVSVVRPSSYIPT
jgi:hypothetical protein